MTGEAITIAGLAGAYGVARLASRLSLVGAGRGVADSILQALDSEDAHAHLTELRDAWAALGTSHIISISGIDGDPGQLAQPRRLELESEQRRHRRRGDVLESKGLLGALQHEPERFILRDFQAGLRDGDR